jgi:hypothetical protein
MGLAVVVRDMREARVPAVLEETAAFETDVLARAAAGLSDRTVSADVSNLEPAYPSRDRPGPGRHARQPCPPRENTVVIDRIAPDGSP